MTVKIACIGTSITKGYGLANPATESYPAILQTLLGSGFEVRNYGVNGAALLKDSGFYYGNTAEFQDMSDSYADIYVIEFGANDLRPGAIDKNGKRFLDSYKELISLLKREIAVPRIFIMSLTPIKSGNREYQLFLSQWHGRMQELIAKAASQTGVELIDICTPLAEALKNEPGLIPDGVHPGAEGAAIIAKAVLGAICHIGGGKDSL